jgi:hypothetical protein
MGSAVWDVWPKWYAPMPCQRAPDEMLRGYGGAPRLDEMRDSDERMHQALGRSLVLEVRLAWSFATLRLSRAR